MYYYRYNNKDELVQKSNVELTGDKVVTYYEDIDIELFRVIVGFVGTDGTMLRHTKFIRSEEMILQRFSEIKESQVLSELDIDYRISIIELGLL